MNVLSIRYGLAGCRNVVTDICCGLLGLLYFVVSGRQIVGLSKLDLYSLQAVAA